MIPIVAVPLLLIFSFRDWIKGRASMTGERSHLRGLITILALVTEWLVPLAFFLIANIAGVGIAYSTPTATAILVLWSTLVAITLGACFFTLKGPARIEAVIAGLTLLGLSILIVAAMTGNWEMT